MRFASPTYTRPSLTPMGHRLLHLSEQKLSDLDYPAGARESGSAMLRSVLVRQTVKSAWVAFDEGRETPLSNWHSEEAMGLDVIGEDEEEEEEEEADGAVPIKAQLHEERWFEDLLASLGEDEGRDEEGEAEWTESSVGSADFDDEVYDLEGMEAYTIPLPPSPPSPARQAVSLPAAAPTWVATVEPAAVEFDSGLSLSTGSLDSAASSIESLEQSMPRTPVEENDPHVAVCEVNIDAEVTLCSESVDLQAIVSNAHTASKPTFTFDLSPPPSLPITPVDIAIRLTSGLLSSDILTLEDIDDCDDFTLPPPLHRSWSSESWTSEDSDCECVTPRMGCSELEEEVAEVVEEEAEVADEGWRPSWNVSAMKDLEVIPHEVEGIVA